MSEKSVVEAVRVSGPLAPYASRFADELRRRGYTELSVAGQVRLMAHASRWLSGKGLGAGELTPERVAAFSAARVPGRLAGSRPACPRRRSGQLLRAGLCPR